MALDGRNDRECALTGRLEDKTAVSSGRVISSTLDGESGQAQTKERSDDHPERMLRVRCGASKGSSLGRLLLNDSVDVRVEDAHGVIGSVLPGQDMEAEAFHQREKPFGGEPGIEIHPHATFGLRPGDPSGE
jgi:hypothetical protein